MKVIVTTLVALDHHEQEIVKEALSPYRVLEGEFTTSEDTAGFPKAINRLSSPLQEAWLLDLHRKVLDLKRALTFDAGHWRRESETAPEEGGRGNLIAKPKAVFTMLSETRERQVQACDCALEVLRNAMQAVKDHKMGGRNLHP